MNETERELFTLHEILHSLMIVRGNLELGGENIEESINEIDRLAAFSQKMLTPHSLKIEPCNIGKLVKDLCPSVKISAKNCIVDCDKLLFSSAMISLLQNSKIHGNGDEEIVISSDKNSVKIQIQNTCKKGESSTPSFGLGLSFVEKVCTTQNASFSHHKKDNVFTVEIIFDVKD